MIIQSSISRFIISLKEQIDIIHSDMYTDISQPILHISRSNTAQIVNIEYSERILSIEVWFTNGLILRKFGSLVQIDLLIDQFDNSRFRFLPHWHVKSTHFSN